MIKHLILTILTLLVLVTPGQVAAATDVYGGVCSNPDTAKSAVCATKTSGNPISGPNGVIVKVTNLLAIVAGVAAIIVIIIGGIKFITSSGDSNGVSSAKETILYALIGLVIIILGKTIITFVVSKL